MSAKAAISLFAKRKFLPLFVLFQAGTFNDNVLKNALIILVTYGGMILFSEDMPLGAVVPIAALLFTMPFLILCTIAGQIADKVDRAIILKWVKRAEFVIMIIAAIGFFVQSTAILAFALVCMGAQSAFFSPTKNAVLPQWLEDEDLITANGLLSGFQFFFILLGMVVGIALVMLGYDKAAKGFAADSFLNGPRLVSIVLLVFAAIGWLAAERLPDAPAPQPDLKINYNPVTSIISVLKTSWTHKNVFRPMMGIAWFYGFSNIMILVLPNYVANIMKYDPNVLTIILVTSTLSILVGALLCTVLARGKEAMGLVAIGIVGVTIFTLDIYMNTSMSTRTELGNLADFKADPKTPRFLLAIMGSSVCAGLYVVPLQAMAQRRSVVELRARLMSAGAVMLNAAVNVVTFGLIGLAYLASLSGQTVKLWPFSFTMTNLSIPPEAPFLAVVLISLPIAAYCIWRVFHPVVHAAAADLIEGAE